MQCLRQKKRVLYGRPCLFAIRALDGQQPQRFAGLPRMSAESNAGNIRAVVSGRISYGDAASTQGEAMEINGLKIEPNADLSYASLSHVNLSDANLSYANLIYANLSNANLSGTNLRGANLRGANLTDANLRGVDLRSADLRSADLSVANLRNANLRNADLRGANLRGADLSDAMLYVGNRRVMEVKLSGWQHKSSGQGSGGMTSEEIERRILALENFAFNIGQMLHLTLSPEMQEELQRIRREWSENKRARQEKAPGHCHQRVETSIDKKGA